MIWRLVRRGRVCLRSILALQYLRGSPEAGKQTRSCLLMGFGKRGCPSSWPYWFVTWGIVLTVRHKQIQNDHTRKFARYIANSAMLLLLFGRVMSMSSVENRLWKAAP